MRYQRESGSVRKSERAGPGCPSAVAARYPISALGFGALFCSLFMVLCSVFFSTPSFSAEMDPLLEEGLEAHKVGNCKKAVEIYTEYLKLHPRSPDALNWRGMCYDDLGQLKKALADYDLAIKVSPNHSELYNNRGEIYRKQKQYGKALASFRKAISLEPDFAEPHYNMGLVYETQGHFRAAMEEYLAYLKANPSVTDSKEVLLRIQALAKKGPGKKITRKRVAQRPPTQQRAQAQPKAPEPERDRKHARVTPAKIPPGMKELGGPTILGFDVGSILGKMSSLEAKKGPGAGGLQPLSAGINLVIYLFFGFTLFMIGKKAGSPLPWLAFVPIASLYVWVKSAGKAGWWLILLLIPLVNIVIWIITSLAIARERGKSTVWGVLLFIPCTTPIALIYLAFSD
jgi:tetratricopeptide (TPR) repeat protein